MDEIRESESIIEELEDICNRNEYIVNLLSELKNNIVSRDEEIKIAIETLEEISLFPIDHTEQDDMEAGLEELIYIVNEALKEIT